MFNIPRIKPTKPRTCRWIILIVTIAVVLIVIVVDSDFFGLEEYFGHNFPPFVDFLLLFFFILFLWFICERLFLRYIMKTR